MLTKYRFFSFILTAIILAGCGTLAESSTPLPTSTDAPSISPTRLQPTSTEALQLAPGITSQSVESLGLSQQEEFPGAVDFSWCGDGMICLAYPDRIEMVSGTAFGAQEPIAASSPGLMTVAEQQPQLAWVDDNTLVRAMFLGETGEEPAAIESGAESVVSLTFSPDGAHIVASTSDGVVKFLDVSSSETTDEWQTSYWLANLAYSPGGDALAGVVQDEFAVVVFDPDTGEELRRLAWEDHASPVLYGAYFSPDWTSLAWVARGTIQLMDANTGELGYNLGHEDFVNAMDWSPDGSLIASSAAGTLEGQFVPLVTLWDVASGTAARSLPHETPIYRVRFSPDGSQLAALDVDGRLLIWAVSR